VKTVNACLIAFRDQIRLRLEPVLHLVAGQRTLIHIAEVSFPGHFIRCGRETHFDWIRSIRRFWGLRLRIFIMFHNASAGAAGMAAPLGTSRCSGLFSMAILVSRANTVESS